MSYSHAPRRRHGGLATTTVLAAKVAFASVAVAALASFARLAVPQIVVPAAGNFLWKLYLFVAVHVIIFIIWKLSDNKHSQPAAQHYKDPWAPAPAPLAEDFVVPAAVKPKEEFAAAIKPTKKEEFVAAIKPTKEFVVAAVKPRGVFVPAAAEYGVARLAPEASPEKGISPDSPGGESCVTTESEEDASSAEFYIADTKRSLAPPAQEHAVLKRELSPPPPAIAATSVDCADDDNDDDLDATWNAIMQKTRSAAAPASPPAKPPSPRRRPRARDPSVGAEELTKRSEDFIKKIHNSFGRQ